MITTGLSYRFHGRISTAIVALITLVWALVATDDAGVAFRDPDNVAALYVVLVGAGGLVYAAATIVTGAVRVAELKRLLRRRST